jgi:phospholipid/cholesterol/gamma-HCH transport system substrate-binding protein
MTRIRGTLVRLAIFVVFSVALSALVFTTLVDYRGRETHTYHAVFTTASGLAAGDAVRIAGVDVGRVGSATLRGDRAYVTFDVATDQQVTTTTKAVIRYQNLLGQRYLALVGARGSGRPLTPGSTIPESRTAPALDLTTLLDGFRPLFAALTPAQVNQLATSLVQVLQGEGTTVGQFLSQAAQLTANLADRDQAIDTVVDNLGAFVQTVAAHDQQLGDTVDALAQLTRGLAAERTAIGDSLQGVDDLAASFGGLLQSARPDLDRDVAGLQQVAQTLAANSGRLAATLQSGPGLFGALGRVTDNGSWLNIYICNLTVNVTGSITIPAGVLGPVPLPLDLPNGRVGSPAGESPICR